MKENNMENNNGYTEKMRSCLRDYSNNFYALMLNYKVNGISEVHKIMREGYIIPSFEKYLADAQYETVTEKELENHTLIQKIKEINLLADEINSKPNITDEEFKSIMKKVGNLIDQKYQF